MDDCPGPLLGAHGAGRADDRLLRVLSDMVTSGVLSAGLRISDATFVDLDGATTAADIMSLHADGSIVLLASAGASPDAARLLHVADRLNFARGQIRNAGPCLCIAACTGSVSEDAWFECAMRDVECLSLPEQIVDTVLQ